MNSTAPLMVGILLGAAAMAGIAYVVMHCHDWGLIKFCT